ncbi:MAG: UDP-N-acetylmuramate--L-alanine ligase [Candidatus Levyibacteriota bacterium]
MNVNRIHFVGIKGVGMAPLAIIAKEAGFVVTGSDVDKEFITDESLKKADISVVANFSEGHVKGADLTIITGAHGGFDNIEAKTAKKLGIPIWTQGQAVGEFMKGELFKRKFYGISVAGSHGKTTTTGMIATVLKEAGLDPTYMIGTSFIPSLQNSGHLGRGEFFVTEADEYATEPVFDKTAKFFWQKPKIAVFTNIDFDHPDLYSSTDEIKDVFLKFAKSLPNDGILVACGDDPYVKKLLTDYKGNVVTYGFSTDNDYKIKKISFSNSQTFFWIDGKNTDFGEFSIKVLGEHNALNALATIVTCLELGVSIDKIKKGIATYEGSKRRFEFIGRLGSGALLFDDYAHHPLEIKKTLKSVREGYPKSRIVCFFQPHTYSRTKKLYDQFTYSFTDADEVIIVDIFPSEREKKDLSVSSSLLVQSIAKLHPCAKFLPGLDDVVKYIDKKSYGRNTLILTMGAGDIYKIKNKLDFENEN